MGTKPSLHNSHNSVHYAHFRNLNIVRALSQQTQYIYVTLA